MANPKLYVGSNNIARVYAGGQIISQIYKGSTLIFSTYAPSGKVFEKTAPGTYTFVPLVTGVYQIICVGAGSGSAAGSDQAKYSGKSRLATGGSGAAVVGEWKLTGGRTYTIVVGAGGAGSGTGMWQWNDSTAGGSSSVNESGVGNRIVCTGGGKAHCAWSDWGGQYAGAAGTVSTVTGYISVSTNKSGNAGTIYGGYGSWGVTASVYGGYGTGGGGSSDAGGGSTQAGGNGYVCISYLRHS